MEKYTQQRPSRWICFDKLRLHVEHLFLLSFDLSDCSLVTSHSWSLLHNIFYSVKNTQSLWRKGAEGTEFKTPPLSDTSLPVTEKKNTLIMVRARFWILQYTSHGSLLQSEVYTYTCESVQQERFLTRFSEWNNKVERVIRRSVYTVPELISTSVFKI